MRIRWFFIGVITSIATLLLLSVSMASYLEGQLTIIVDPIRIQVNGEEFHPKDVNGNEVLVFAYNGTTYAPLRALAESYGLNVGYDASLNMATVGKEAQILGQEHSESISLSFNYTYDEFKSLWNQPQKNEHSHTIALLAKNDDMVIEWLSKASDELKEEMFSRYAKELYNNDDPLSTSFLFLVEKFIDNKFRSIVRVSTDGERCDLFFFQTGKAVTR